MVAVGIIAPDGRILMTNQGALELTGYSNRELKGQPCTFLISPEDRDRIGRLVQTVLGEGDSLSRIETNIVRKDNTKRTVSFDMGPVRFTHGTTGAVATAEDITPARRAEETLRQNQANHRFLVEAATDIIVTVDDHDRILFANPAIERTLGYTPSELAGKEIVQLLPRSVQAPGRRWSAYFDLKDDYIRGVFIPLVHKSGREIVVDASLGRFNMEGRVVFSAIMRDVTTHAHYEKALHENEQRLHLALKAGKMAPWDWDLRTDMITLRREVFDTEGFEVSLTQPAETWFERIHPDDRARVRNVVTAALAERREYQVTYQISSETTPPRWVEERAIGRYDERGRCVSVQGLIGDITDRKMTEFELTACEERYRTALETQSDLERGLTQREQDFFRLVENSPDIISRLDRNLTFLYVSPAVNSLLRLQPESFPGKTAREIGIHIHEFPAFETACRQVLETGTTAYREVRFGDKWYRSRIEPEFGVSGDVDFLICIDQDISEQKRTESELRRLSSRLLDLQDAERRRIARELHDGTAQNLFAIHIGLSRLMQLDPTEASRATIQECLLLCEQSREEIRTLSYLLHPPILDEGGLVLALKWYADGFCKRSGIQVELQSGPRVGRLPIDIETDLFRVVQECLSNIHRHSGSSKASVQLDRDAEEVVLKIQDWGHGMPAEVASGRTTESIGVGIAGMRERLGQHSGHLEITSSESGTIVTAVIPLNAVQWPYDSETRQETG